MTREELRKLYGRKNLEAKNWFLKEGTYVILPSALDGDPEIKIADRVIFGYLLGRIRPRGKGRCFPALETIAAYCDVSLSTAQRSLRKLRKLFWIRWERTGRSHEFRLLDPVEREALIQATNEARAQGRRAKDPIKETGQPARTDWSE